MKKLLATVLVLVMALSIFAGCGGGSNTGTTPGGQQGGTNGSGETVRPVVTVGIPFSTNVEDYDTNKYTLWLEEKTGIDIEIVQYPSAAADYKAKITTQIVGGEDLPDLLWRMAIGDDAWKQYADEGYILNLKPLLDDKEKSKVFWERIDEINKLVPDHWPTIQRRITYTTVDGEEGWWCFGRWEQTLYDNIWPKPFINKTWLDNLSLEMPTDAASLANVLKKFKTEDANKNGDNTDEIPLYQSGGENTAYDAVLWFINMFECCMPNMNWNVKEDGKLLCPYTTDAYREGLKYARDLFNAGVFNTALKSGSTGTCKTLLASNPSTVGVVLAHPSLGFQPNDMNLKNFVAMPQWAIIQRGEQAGDRNAFLTESAEDNIDDVWKLVMQMMTKESSIWQRYGEFGSDWTWADQGTKSWFGIDAEIKILDGDNYWTTVDNAAWHSIGCTILTHAEFENVQKEENGSEWYTYKMTIQGDNYQYTIKREAEQKANGEYITAPIMVYNTEDTEELRAVRSNVRNVFTTMRSKFVYGTEGWDPFDNQDWEDYKKMVMDEGYEEYYAQAQKVFNYNYPKWPSLEQ